MAKEKLNSLIDTAGRGDIIPIEESPLKRFLPKRESISESIQKLNSTSTPSTLFDLRNVPINLIVKSNTSSDRYLTSQGTEQEVILAPEDTGNPHQRFSIDFMPLTGYITIKNVEDKLLSAGHYTSNPDVDILYVKDNTSSTGAMWDFLDIGPNTDGYILQNSDLLGFDGSEPTLGNIYNKVIGAQGSSIYFDKYRNLTKQQFEIQVVDDFEIQSIDYINDARTTLTQVPDFVVNWSYSNGSSVQQSMTTNFGGKASRTSNFSQSSSFSFKTTASIKTGVPFLASGQIQTEIGSSHQFTYGESETLEDTRSYDFPLLVPSNTRVLATARVTQFELNVPYIATLKGKNTGTVIKVAGVWKGVDLTDVDVTVTETSLTTGTSRVTKQFKQIKSN
ncbi:MAG: hypothetical protein ACTHZ7_03755 [Sphingobacterium sp.]